MSTFTESDRVGDIVSQFPQARDVFKRYGIDFCCGGNRLLQDATRNLGVDVRQVMNDLDLLRDESIVSDEHKVDWSKESLQQLVDHIVTVHHAYLQKTLPILGELVTKVFRVHGLNHAELTEVHRLFHSLKLEFEQHLIKEETLVFPRIVEFSAMRSQFALNAALEAIEELETEHDLCGGLLKEIRAVTQGYLVPSDACGTYDYTFSKLTELESDTFIHIHLENNILFPRLRAAKDESIALLENLSRT